MGVVVAGLAIPFAGVLGHRRPRRGQGDGQPPDRAEDRAAGPEDQDPGLQGQPDRDDVRREPRQRPAPADLADHGQVDHRDRGLPLLRARRPRPARHAPRPGHQPGQQRRGPGWLVDHPADGQADPAQPGQDPGRAEGRHRRHLRAQDPRAPLRHRLRGELLQGLDPRALPQHRLLRRRRLRRPVGRPPLLRHQRQEPRPPPVGDAGRPGEEPHRLRPDQQPRRGAPAPQRRPGPDGRAERHHPREGRPDQGHGPRARRRRSPTTAASTRGPRSSATTSSTC